MRKSATSLASMVHPGPYGVYQTRDGYLILSSSPLPALQTALALPELEPIAKMPYNFEHRERIAEIVEPVIRTRTTAEWLERLPPHGVWAAPVLNYDGLFAHPVMQGADVTEEVEHPVAGRVRLLRFPLEFSSGRAGIRRLPPASGEHTDEILQELGYTQDERARFRHAKVV
jgi:crotonobetainyl-CoA:carnitine CoA-transferase CaiB-like acyl-CoA transferase